MSNTVIPLQQQAREFAAQVASQAPTPQGPGRMSTALTAVGTYLDELSFRVRWSPRTIRLQRRIRRLLGTARRWGSALLHGVWSGVAWPVRSLLRLVRRSLRQRHEHGSSWRYVISGARITFAPLPAWLFDLDGLEDCRTSRRIKVRAGDDNDDKRTAETLREYRRAKREYNKDVAKHGALLTRRLLVPPTVIALVTFLVVIDMGTLVAVAGALIALIGGRILRKRGERFAAIVDGTAEASTEQIRDIDSGRLVRALAAIGLKNVECPWPVVENGDKTGIRAFMQLAPGDTVTDRLMPIKQRRALASALRARIDESQIIITQGEGAEEFTLDISYTKPSERELGESPYAESGVVTNILERVVFGVNSIGEHVSTLIEQAIAFVGKTRWGKTTALFSLIAAGLRDPTAVVFLAALKGGGDFAALKDRVSVFINCDGSRDTPRSREAIDRTYAALQVLDREVDRRAELLDEMGRSEVTPEMSRTIPDLYSILFIIDELRPLIARHPEAKALLEALLPRMGAYGVRIAVTVQGLDKHVDANFISKFNTKFAVRLNAGHENTAVLGENAVSLGYNASTIANRGSFIINGVEGFQSGQAFNWTDEGRAALARDVAACRQTPVAVVDLEDDETSDAPVDTGPELSASDLAARLLAIRDEGTFGDKGVWAQEYPELSALLGMDVETLITQLKDMGVNTSWQIAKNGANQRGFRFDHLPNQPTKGALI